MGSQRISIILPFELLDEIDSLFGRRGRSTFFAEAARVELRHRKFLAILRGDKPAWRDEDHPRTRRRHISLGQESALRKQHSSSLLNST